uniref:Uncharacterized protein n=1 Tax=Anguilla anguilla TaxID=7936 RepID=A0A0E9TZR7_ANGAN
MQVISAYNYHVYGNIIKNCIVSRIICWYINITQIREIIKD